MTGIKKKLICFAAVFFAVITAIGVYFAADLNGDITASAATEVNGRVTPLELMSIHNVDWIMGPLDVNADGSYKSTNIDSHHNATNNVYGIPAYQYFNINSYLYITESGSEKILRGWKNNIQKVALVAGQSITQDGYIERNGVVSTDLGIYVDANITASANKYMLIMPDDITQIGTGSGAFDGVTSIDNKTSGTATGEYADFTDFAFYVWPGEAKYNTFTTAHSNYWSPRERLVGVYFNSTSQLKSVNDGVDTTTGTLKCRHNTPGKAAFTGCNNMKFLVLPDNNSITKIGNYAFSYCEQLRDFNIPSSVTSIGTYALKSCSNMPHLTISSNVATVGSNAFAGMTKLSDVENHSSEVDESSFPDSKLLNFYDTTNGSQLYVVGNDEDDKGASGYYFCKNVLGYSDTLATVTNVTNGNENYKKDNWYVVALAGKDDTKAEVVRRFPKSVTVNDARRSNVLYDYLNSDGKKCTNTLSETISKYDIGNGMAKETWCCNAVLPASVEIIGDNAFDYSHTVYLEMHATTVGSNAFDRNADSDSPGDQQNYYIHKAITKYGGNVFSGDPAGRTQPLTRRFIFEDKTLYNTYVNATGTLKSGNVFSSNNGNVTKDWRYQIPIIANVVSANGDVNLITGDMDARFDYDADYDTHKSVTGADADGNGTYDITYTKRLNGFNFNTVKTQTGQWTEVTSTDHGTPVIEGMDSTKWYTDDTYGTETTAVALYSSSATSVTVYTKNIARPENIKDKTYDGVYKGQYTFGETYTFGSTSYTLGDDPSQNIDFYTALGLSSTDYSLDVKTSPTTTKTCDFAFPNGESGSADNLHNAGTYTFTISLNPKWGVWSQDYRNAEENKGYFSATINVERKKLDYSSLDKIPQFVNAADNNIMHGNATPLYNYNDGWYVAQQNGAEPNDTRTVTNAYCYYTGNPIAVKLSGEAVSADGSSSTLGDSLITFRDGLKYTNSSRYTATFQFQVKTLDGNSGQSNYYFDYGDNSYGISDEMSGVSMSNQQWNTFRLTKRWYLVIETNMFIENGGNNEPYSPLGNPTVTYADAITARVPALYKGNNAGSIEFEILYTPVGGRSTAVKDKTTLGSGINSVGYYINSYMPAGEYTLRLYGSSVTVGDKTYPAITGEYTITVLPREFTAVYINAIHTVMNGNGGNAYPINGTDKALHDSITTQQTTLNNSLIMPASGNYWSDKSSYFSNAVTITYNWEGSGQTAYSSYTAVRNEITTPEKYTLYYCISAKNYVTVGGEDASDRTDRSFSTTLYTEMRFEDIYSQIVDVNGTYFKDVTYNGSTVQPRVPGNQYYYYEFQDADYINARTKASVTLTLYDAKLARWNTDIGSGNFTSEQIAAAPDYYELSTDKTSLKIFFNILPADNSWISQPLVPGWAHNGFDASVYTIMGTLAYNDAEVYYRIGTLENGEYEWIDMGGSIARGSEYFTVNETGMVTDETVIAKLNGLNVLPAGQYYYLGSYVNDTSDGNVNGFEAVPSPYNRILISKAVNVWTTAPVLTPYQYTRFSSDFIAGVPKYSDAENVVYKFGDTELKTEKDENGQLKLSEAAIKVLNEQNVGNYEIIVTLDGDDNYLPINDRIRFTVMIATTNTWKVLPSIQNWVYGTFRTSMVTNGLSDFGTTYFTIQKVKDDGNVGDDVENYTNLNATGIQTALLRMQLDAGSYNLRVISRVPDDAEFENYVSTIPYDLRFTVAKAPNNWKEDAIPTIEGWVYGETPKTPAVGDTVKENSGIESAYYEADRINGVWVASQREVAASDIGSAGAGYYAYVTTAKESTNYEGVTYTSVFQIERAQNRWKEGGEPEGMFIWTWGETETAVSVNSGFVKAEAEYMNDDKLVTYTIKGSNGFSGSFSKDKDTDLRDVIDELKKLGVGSYEITVSVVATGSYSDVSRSTFVTVLAASFEWSTEPTGSSWTWGVKDSEKVFTEPQINAVPDSGVKFTYKVGVKDSEATSTFETYSLFLANMKARNAGTYTVTVTVSCLNYNDLVKSVEVKINQAANSWTANTPAETLEREYTDKTFAISKAEAEYGTVVYKYLSGSDNVETEDISVVNAWINSLGRRDTPYIVTVEVQADPNGNFSGLKADTKLTVTGVLSHWDNESVLVEEYNSFVYSADLADNLKTVVIPNHTLHTEGEFAGDSLTYTIVYNNYNNSLASPVTTAFGNAASVSDYLAANAKAGTYTITAGYNPNNSNYTTLSYTVTVKVARATAEWDDVIQTEYINTFEDVKMPTPTAGAYPVTVTVADDNGTSYPLTDGDLHALLNTLNVGTYTVISKVEETGNYTGLSAVSTRVVITPASNAWKDPSVLRSVWEFERLETINITVPESLRGTVRCIVRSVPLAAGTDLNVYLNSIADAQLTEGTHTLSFLVDADPNGNYNELVYDCLISISKKANGWVSGKEPVVAYDDWSGTVNVSDFAMPEPQYHAELLRFDIDKVVGPAEIASSHNLDVTAFTAKLAELVNGTYRITVRVGGDCGNSAHNTDPKKAEITAYNANYAYLEGTTVITVTPNKNQWEDELENASWTLGETVGLTAPKAEYGNDTVTFTVSGSDVTGTAVSSGTIDGVADGTSTAATAFSRLKTYLGNLKAGTYTVTANVPATNVYEAPQATTALIVISVAENSWKDSLVANSTIIWKYGAADNREIEFEPAHDDGNKMVILVNNKKFSEDTLQEYLETLGVSTYVIKATVPANAEYALLEKIITLKIEKSDENGWALDASDNELKLEISEKWTWDDISGNSVGWDTGLVTPMPKYGSSVDVTVKKGDAEQFTVTLTYVTNSGVKTVNANDVDLLKEKLWTLDVGNYTITATITETDDYVSYTQTPVAFEIEQADNAWKSSSDVPHISGWSYSGETAYPSSDPKYGNKNDVRYSYAPVIIDDGEENDDDCKNVGNVTTWNSALPIDGGMYYIRGILAGTTNYKELIGYGTFSIGAGQNEWVDMPSVIAWSWNGYVREVNQFSASARNGGKVSFSIDKQGESQSGYVALSINDFLVHNGTPLTASQIAVLGKFGFVKDGNGHPTKMVSAEVAAVLNALKPGTYRLRAVVEATANFEAKEGVVPFVVGKADNEWNVDGDNNPVAPNVLSYSYNSFVESGDRVSFTAGSAKYGTVSYQVTDGSGQTVIATTSDVNALIAKLKPLKVGNYILKSWVAADANAVYKPFYSQSAPYSVLFSIARIENAWAEDNEPNTSVHEFYSELHKTGFDFEGWFGNPATVYNDAIVFTLLNTDYTPAKSGEYAYADLFEAVKGLNSGDYIVRMTVAQSENYLALVADTSLSIKRKANNFSLASSVSGQWKKENDQYKTTLAALGFTADYKDNATFTLDNVEYNSYAELGQAINDKKFDAGSYQITVTVRETNEYEGFSQPVQLDIEQDDNEWKNGWTIEESLNVSPDAAGGIKWTYETEINWIGARPKYGTLVYVDIRKDGASAAFSYTDVNYADESAAASSVKNVRKVLSELDGGDYVITVTAPADTNWKQKSDSVGFTIKKASNDWKADDRPKLVGATVGSAGTLTYIYDKLAVQPKASALHGVPEYVYYADGSTTPLKATPVNAGKYKVEFKVVETDNYEGLSKTLSFVIAKDSDESFIVSNGTVGWTWGEYDRTTHVFTGIPKTGGEVSYVILDSKGNEVVRNIILGDSNGVHHNDFDKDTYVTVADAVKIGALPAGDYRLNIIVGEMPNYEGFTASTPFKVTPAQNYWTVTPKITSWSLGLWDAEKNMPVAESRFGSPVIKIVSRNNNELFFEATYNRTTGSYDIALDRLENAPAGMYTMTAKVKAEEGKYHNPLEETVPLEVYKRGSFDEKNYWYDTPGITPWEANIENIVNVPYGTPLRGLPYFEFYKSKRDESNKIVIDWDSPVVSGEDSFLVEKGDNKYYKDFYMPMAPGYYYMVACAISLDGDGNIIQADTLRELPLEFQIRNRENSFKDDPHIDTLLFLGDRASWAGPTAEATLGDSIIVFKYKNKLTGEDLGIEMPRQPGQYIVTAYASAKYSQTIDKSAEFTVELSTNEWVDHPSIEDWTEEFEANSPLASAQYGSDRIVYTYENLATGEILTEKPTTEGSYKLIATVELEGYRDLVGTATFTIGPAFDTDLLIVDIILGLVACGLTIWVICLAIKKRKKL